MICFTVLSSILSSTNVFYLFTLKILNGNDSEHKFPVCLTSLLVGNEDSLPPRGVSWKRVIATDKLSTV